jgi:hypothetical protein
MVELMLDTPWLTATLVVGLLAIAAAAVFARRRQTHEIQELDLEENETSKSDESIESADIAEPTDIELATHLGDKTGDPHNGSIRGPHQIRNGFTVKRATRDAE